VDHYFMLSALCFTLWLDLRGDSCTSDLDKLLDLYAGVRKRFDAAGLPPPVGSAVAGVLHSQADLDEDDGDGGLSLLALDSERALWLDGVPAGRAIVEEDWSLLETDQYLALLGDERTVLQRLDGALAQVKEAVVETRVRDAPYLLTEVGSAAGLAALAECESTDGALSGVLPLGAVLKPNEALWFEALNMPASGRTAEAPILRASTPPPSEASTARSGGKATARARTPGGGRATTDGESGDAPRPPSRRARRRARAGGRGRAA
jgi:hypothetical protein